MAMFESFQHSMRVKEVLIGSVLRLEDFIPRSPELFLGNYGHNADDKDIITTADFMRCSTIDPDARPRASELVKDEWFQDA